ncbi:2-dehydro-3-deoxygalactonokinase [Stappia sp. F7233]|uniref:2-dehydro-3-deoxygalactonokinase n=1 Tax=Stappia albiluteola TaxID=2758565 RepID=A0A839AAU4_9HYPH|nr:2-dehydro-3-deoxygalactonokinase [Stappia albiluteola]MBA5776027.1 2-dehydro-3-deoxygalactonokinase [Stappia albiluteola]
MTEIASIGVDWGTSSFRLWLLARDGAVLAERRSGQGMQGLAPDAFEPALAGHLAALRTDGLAVPKAPRIVICGMAGARQGWREAPYMDLPTALNDLPSGAIEVENGLGADIRILPGIARRNPDRPDVMRGEETQILGLAGTSQKDLSATIILPGTHSKWSTVEKGRVTDFSTAMTGELFALLREHSLLRHSLGAVAIACDPLNPAFRRGLTQSTEKPANLLQAVFSLRARSLLFGAGNADIAAELSGLLIGAEIAGALRTRPERLILAANAQTGPLYAAALHFTGMNFDTVDVEKLACAGLHSAARLIWPTPREI